MPAPLDLTGQRFGRLVAIELGPPKAFPSTTMRRWRCRCDCGSEALVLTMNLRDGNTQSCGCWKAETTRTNGFKNRKGTATYHAAHQRLRRERGRAIYLPCADCEAPAIEWSYDGTDPDELTQVVTDGRKQATRAVAYSLKPEHYSPRCRSCHVKFDHARAKEAADA